MPHVVAAAAAAVLLVAAQASAIFGSFLEVMISLFE
jgi:hypothetical protein